MRSDTEVGHYLQYHHSPARDALHVALILLGILVVALSTLPTQSRAPITLRLEPVEATTSLAVDADQIATQSIFTVR